MTIESWAWSIVVGPATPRARRRAGLALLAFGLSGLVLLMLAGLLALGSLGAVAATAADLEAQRARLVALMPPAEQALRGSAQTATGAAASLRASAATARNGANLVTQLAQAMDGMSSSADIEVLGIKPFAGLADELANVADRSRTLATDLATTASALDTNVEDSLAAAHDLATLANALASVRKELEASALPTSGDRTIESSLALARLVLIGLLLWLAVPAALATWLGSRWARGPRSARPDH